MKKYLKYLKYILATSLVAFIVVVACDEDNLDLQPLSPTEVSYFNTEDEVERLIFAVYAKQTDLYYFNSNNPIHPVWLLPGDDLTTMGSYAYETFNGLQPSDNQFSEYLDGGYGVISRANIALEKIEEKRDEVFTTAGMADNLRGEALFLRALWHFNMANLFGNIPLSLERYTEIAEAKKPNNTYMEILDQCITDLEEAATLLPDSWSEKYIGRVTASAAYGLLGKLYCFRACYGSSASQDYAKAIAAFDNISLSVKLTDHYGSNFDTWDENNQESLYEFQASNAAGLDNIWLWNGFGNIGSMSSYWGFFNNTWSFWAHTPFMPTTKLMNMFDAGDPRVDEIYESNAGSAWQPLGVEFVKYTKRERQGDVTSSLNNPRILRLADVKLLEAEAQLQTGNMAEATNLVNQIRERARKSVPDPETDPESTVPADLATVDMQDIMDERLRELCGEEHHRWDDLKRWDAAGYIDLSGWGAGDNHFSSVRSDFDFTYPTNLLYPIPLSELDYNENVVQNPGY